MRPVGNVSLANFSINIQPNLDGCLVIINEHRHGGLDHSRDGLTFLPQAELICVLFKLIETDINLLECLPACLPAVSEVK